MYIRIIVYWALFKIAYKLGTTTEDVNIQNPPS